MLVLPPRARDGGRILRSSDEFQFSRPVEGEVVLGQHPRLTWTPIEGATSYRITINEVEGSYEWHSETSERSISLPEAAPLPLSRDFRAFLEPVPTDLARPGGISVSFRTGNFAAFASHRLTASSLLGKILAWSGLLLIISALCLRSANRLKS